MARHHRRPDASGWARSGRPSRRRAASRPRGAPGRSASPRAAKSAERIDGAMRTTGLTLPAGLAEPQGQQVHAVSARRLGQQPRAPPDPLPRRAEGRQDGTGLGVGPGQPAGRCRRSPPGSGCTRCRRAGLRAGRAGGRPPGAAVAGRPGGPRRPAGPASGRRVAGAARRDPSRARRPGPGRRRRPHGRPAAVGDDHRHVGQAERAGVVLDDAGPVGVDVDGDDQGRVGSAASEPAPAGQATAPSRTP